MSPERTSRERIALYTTVYPSVERYLGEWWRSVAAQSDQDFDLWIGADGLDAEAVYAAMGARPAAEWVFAEPGDTPAQIRERAIRRIVARYPAVVFADSDDVLAPSRIAGARAALRTLDVSACALRIIDEDGRDVGCTFGPPPEADPAELLPRYNVFGLSNTAYRSDVLARCLPVPPQCVLFDWAIAVRAWMLGARLGFDPTPEMWYRQHPANTARVLQPFTPEQVLRAAEHVLVFYRGVLGAGDVVEPYRTTLARAYERAATFHRTITQSTAVLARYVEGLNRLTPQYVWWWCIAHPDLEDVWRN